MKDLQDAMIYHYTSSRIYDFDGYVWMPDIKDSLVEFYDKNKFQTMGIRYWLDMSMILLKRLSLGDTDPKLDQPWRGNDIWFYFLNKRLYPGTLTFGREISSIHLILEGNDDFMHLFTYDKLDKIIKVGDKICNKYSARHENDDNWELVVYE